MKDISSTPQRGVEYIAAGGHFVAINGAWRMTQDLGTGQFLASVLDGSVSLWMLLPLIFVLSAITGFSIGSSWGTFAIMLPLAIPLAMTLGLPPAPFIAAAISGGIFGDHASPISDTTIIASMASGSSILTMLEHNCRTHYWRG